MPRTALPSIRISLALLALAALGTLVFLGAALGSSSADYALHLGDTATWSNVDVQCQNVGNQQGGKPVVCGRASAGKGPGVIFTRGTIVVYNRAGDVVFKQKRSG